MQSLEIKSIINYTEIHQNWYHIFSSPLSLRSIPVLGNKIYQKRFVNLLSIKVYKLSVSLHDGCQSSTSEKLQSTLGNCLWAALQKLFIPQYGDINICPGMIWSMKHKHTNKKYINKASKHFFKLDITWPMVLKH
jgi:hypothetical protein